MKINLREGRVNQLRKNDLVPGVIYGKGIDPTPIQIDSKEITKAFHKYGSSMTFEVTLGKDTHLVYIKDNQTDYLHNYSLTHVDLMKVSETDTITSDIALNFLHRDEVGIAGEVLSINLNEVEVEFTVGKGVSHIDVDLSPLKTKNALYVRDLVLPEGLKINHLPDQIVANLTAVAEEKEEVEEIETVYLTDDREETEEE